MSEWLDREDEHTEAINAVHPLRTGNHALRATANEMVGNRHSKGALVDLVNWLLVEKLQRDETINKMAEALLYALQQHEGRLTPMHNDWSAGARNALKLAEPYIKKPTT